MTTLHNYLLLQDRLRLSIVKQFSEMLLYCKSLDMSRRLLAIAFLICENCVVDLKHDMNLRVLLTHAKALKCHQTVICQMIA